MNFFHGTSLEKANMVKSQGFNLCFGRFGHGAYFYANKESSTAWGKTIIEVAVDMRNILVLDYDKDIPYMFEGVSVEEEEGVPELEAFCKDKYSGVLIKYSDGVEELCIYDSSKIKIV